MASRFHTTPLLSATKEVACIETDPDAYAAIEHLLVSRLGDLSVLHFSTAIEALAECHVNTPRVLIIHSEPPDVPAIECTRRLKSCFPSLQVILRGSMSDFHHIVLALTAGASGYLVAPVMDRDLINAVKNIGAGVPFLCRRTVLTIVKGLNNCGVRFGKHSLSAREQQVAVALLERRSDKAIAEYLHISPHTARVHMKHVLKKLGVHTRNNAVKRYLGVG